MSLGTRMGAETVKKLKTLEAIRGVAALLVLLYHLQDVFSARAGIIPFGGAFAVGDCGVDLFFVLSGFIITTMHAKDLGRPVRLYSFLYKRLCRLLPSVWILTALALMIYTLPIGNIAKLGKLAPSNIAASFMLLPQAQPALVNVTWTLTYEMFFYGLFAVAIVSRPVGLVALACWQLATGLALVGVWHSQTWLGTYYLRPICLEFGIGMICAVIAQHEQLRRRLPVAVLGALLLAGTTLFIGGMVFEDAVHHHLLGPERLLIYGLGPGLLIFGCAAIEFDRQVPVPKLLVWLGTASYAIYLTNYSVLTLIAVVMLHLNVMPVGWISSAGFAVLAVAAGGAFHALIDQPIQDRLRRRTRQPVDARLEVPVLEPITILVQRSD